jgi:hypothetical protein
MIRTVHDNNVIHGDLTSVSLYTLQIMISDLLNMFAEQCPDCCRWIATPCRFRYLEHYHAIEPSIFLPHWCNSLGCTRVHNCPPGRTDHTIRNRVWRHIRSGWYHASCTKSLVGLIILLTRTTYRFYMGNSLIGGLRMLYTLLLQSSSTWNPSIPPFSLTPFI